MNDCSGGDLAERIVHLRVELIPVRGLRVDYETGYQPKLFLLVRLRRIQVLKGDANLLNQVLYICSQIPFQAQPLCKSRIETTAIWQNIHLSIVDFVLWKPIVTQAH